jgi:hypothetical protein
VSYGSVVKCRKVSYRSRKGAVKAAQMQKYKLKCGCRGGVKVVLSGVDVV